MDLLNAYARCVRIVRDQETHYEVDPDRLSEDASVALYNAVQQAQARLPEEPTVDNVLNAIQALVPSINAFFDDVLVMAPDTAIRHNRLGLVQQVASLPQDMFDLSKLEGF